MTKKQRILVADDDRFTREMLRVILEKAGYELIFAEDGLTAVEKTKAEKPDLVITDGLLPKLHGFMVCKQIKQLDSPPKVVIVTAVYTKPTYKWEVTKDYGADDIMLKPFKTQALLGCIQKHLAGEPIVADEIAEAPAINDSEAASVGAIH